MRVELAADDYLPHTQSAPSSIDTPQKERFSWLQAIAICVLLLAALIPRLVLANQLDLVTDELVYIYGGELYIPLVGHLFTSIGAHDWMFNYEHPPLVKLLIGLFILINNALGGPLAQLMAARLPSVIFGTLLVLAIYLLASRPFGKSIAFGAALCLAFSPWLVYFSALAYLDMTMTTLITIAYLLLWQAIHKPRLYLVVALLFALGAASKYTATLAIPGALLFVAYYFLFIRPRLPEAERPATPWKWWIASFCIALLLFLLVDPAIWSSPVVLLIHSFAFEWEHSINGHLTFIAGQYVLHVPHWAIIYIIATKMSALITVPAVFFLIFAAVRLVRFHLRKPAIGTAEATALAFLFIWVISILGMFSLLNIVVGTHYHLPLAPPVALAGVSGLAILLTYATKWGKQLIPASTTALPQNQHQYATTRTIGGWQVVIFVLLVLLAAVPHLIGLVTIPEEEGYTSIFFNGENTALQVAYPGYREALQWLEGYDQRPDLNVGLVALPTTLQPGYGGPTWYDFNQPLAEHFHLAEAHPSDKTYPYNYLVWPMHLVQRGYTFPKTWRIVHVVMGGNTTYCYILAPPATATTPRVAK
jgi:4-amino-4-deoxy-L-arabinose transferase-like glycosyltransferase